MDQNDRISFSYGMKLSLPTKYESADFHISLGSDLQSGETALQALARVKSQVMEAVSSAYQQIRESDTGVISEQTQVIESKPADTKNVKKAKPESVEARVTQSPETKPASPVVRDTKAGKELIKQAFGVLEARKKITKPEFVAQYLNNKRTDDLNDIEVNTVLTKIRSGFPELGL